MKPLLARLLLLLAGAGFVLASAVRAADLKEHLDTASDGKLLDSHFGRYGHAISRSILRAEQTVHFQLPADTEGVGQTGLYSYFVVAGDFEFTATFEIVSVSPPEIGYGAGIGIAVEGKQAADNLSLTWRHVPKKGSNYVVSHGPNQESSYFSTRAESGRLALRRAGNKLICLVADGDAATLRELCQVPFTDGTIRALRIFADPGGAQTGIDAQVGNVRVRAEEITGGIPTREKSGGIAWWLALAAVTLAALALFWRWRSAQ